MLKLSAVPEVLNVAQSQVRISRTSPKRGSTRHSLSSVGFVNFKFAGIVVDPFVVALVGSAAGAAVGEGVGAAVVADAFVASKCRFHGHPVPSLGLSHVVE